MQALEDAGDNWWLLRRSGRWDAARWGAPINQHDMAATALLFGVVFVEGVRQFGVPVSRAEAEDYVHLWRLSSWLMGVEEALLPADEAACRRQAELIELTQGPPDEDARVSGPRRASTNQFLPYEQKMKNQTLQPCEKPLI